MAIPLLAIGAGYKLISDLFRHRPDYNLPPDPKFFGKEYEDVQAALRQRTQARYGGAGADLRETLANQGVLGNQGALTDAFTRLSLGENQDISAGAAGLAESELGAQNAFKSQKYGAGVQQGRDIYSSDIMDRNRNLDLVTSLGGNLGKLLGAKEPAVGATQPKVYNPNDILYGSGLGLEAGNENPFYKRILKALFGFGG